MASEIPSTRLGRVFLHLACLLRGKRVRWHVRGILREFEFASRKEGTHGPSRMSCRTKILLMAALLSHGIARASEPATLVLLTNAQVTAEGVFLSQIVSEVPSLASVRLADSPAFGAALILTRAQIQTALEKAAPDLFTTNWTGAERVRIARRARTFKEPELLELLTARLQRDHVGERGELELRLMRPWTPVPVPDGPLDFRILELPSIGVSPNFIARFELSAGQEQIGAWQVLVQAKIWRDVWVARSALKRGQLLSESDLARERRDVLALRDLLPSDFESLLELCENVPAGTPLSARSVRLRPLVRRGQMADALVQDGALMMLLKVEVLENGLAGQIVRVRNLQSRREFRGKVQNEQTILVSL